MQLDDVPTKFPASLAQMPTVQFGEQATGVRLAYRPRETIFDGTGWSSETIGLLQRNGKWARLSMASLGIPAGLWPGADMVSTGALNDAGDRLAFDASSGVIVIDLRSGRFRHHLGDVGWVGGIKWHPGGRRFTADPWRRGPDLVVEDPSGAAAPQRSRCAASGSSPVVPRSR